MAAGTAADLDGGKEGIIYSEYTDDAEVWAAFNGPVAVIPGEAGNRKITFPEDFVIS
jgi:2-C-methyl-D-erythritol 4-phosphate cytidylyltransferase